MYTVATGPLIIRPSPWPLPNHDMTYGRSNSRPSCDDINEKGSHLQNAKPAPIQRPRGRPDDAQVSALRGTCRAREPPLHGSSTCMKCRASQPYPHLKLSYIRLHPCILSQRYLQRYTNAWMPVMARPKIRPAICQHSQSLSPLQWNRRFILKKNCNSL